MGATTLSPFDLHWQKKTGQVVSWFRPDDTLDVMVFASVLGEIDDQALRQGLVKLKDAELMSVTDLEEHLLLCRGPRHNVRGGCSVATPVFIFPRLFSRIQPPS